MLETLKGERMNDLSTLKAHLDAAWNQLTESDLYRRAQAEATEAFRELRTPPRIYQRLDELQESIFETAALMSDDDIAEMLDTIANEKDVKMAEYKLPAEAGVPEVVAEVPIEVGFDEGPVVLSAGATAADPLPGPGDTDLNRKVRDEIYRQLSGHYGDFNVPTQKEAQAVIDAVAGHLLNAVPDDSADDVMEALGI